MVLHHYGTTIQSAIYGQFSVVGYGPIVQKEISTFFSFSLLLLLLQSQL